MDTLGTAQSLRAGSRRGWGRGLSILNFAKRDTSYRLGTSIDLQAFASNALSKSLSSHLLQITPLVSNVKGTETSRKIDPARSQHRSSSRVEHSSEEP